MVYALRERFGAPCFLCGDEGNSITSSSSKRQTVFPVTEYIWGSNGLAGISQGLRILLLLYDAEGSPIGFLMNGIAYTYVKNIQGDIIKILDNTGAAVVSYTYDPWGVPTATGNTIIAEINPCTYRGYDYDEDTGYFYLQSRYYDPENCRFINVDDSSLIGITSSLISNNLFVYCQNNAINMCDATGYLGKHWWNSVNFIGKIIDAVLILMGVVSTNKTLSALKRLIRKNRKGITQRVWRRICGYFTKLTVSWLSTAVDVALVLFGSSIGDLIARALDYIDPWWGYKKSNGYILN